MASNNPPEKAGAPDYDDHVLDAGWLPCPEAVSPEPDVHPPKPSAAAHEDADAFIQGIYRSEGRID